MMRLAALLFVLGLTGCQSCDDDRRVPFRSDAGSGSGADAPPPRPFEPRTGQVLPAGTRQVAVEGGPLAAGPGELHVLLPLDLDEDGDRDVLYVRSAEGTVALARAVRDGAAFAPADLDAASLPDGCVPTAAALRTVSRTLGLASIAIDCEGEPMQVEWAFTLEREPRVRERFVLFAEGARAPGAVSLALQPVDRDDDGLEDLVAQVTVTAPEVEPITVELEWLDRPGGFARSRAEPGALLADLAERGAAALERDRAGALGLARQARVVFESLCREGGRPRLGLRGEEGLQCGRTSGAGKARAVEAAALTRLGRPFEALRVGLELEGEGLAVGEPERQLVARAWASVPSPASLRSRALAEQAPVEGREVRYGLLAFLDDDTLLVRDGQPRTLDVRSGAATVLPPYPAPRPPLSDPSGRLAALDVRRTCTGFVVEVVPSDSLAPGTVVTSLGRTVPLAEAPPPPGVRCDRPLPSAVQADDGGWVLLGWAPQGLVAGRGEELRVLPIDTQGRPFGPPTALLAGDPLPAPLAGGGITPSGSAYLVASPHGLLLRSLDGPGSVQLLRPAGFSSWGPVHAIALAPGGRRAAVFAGGTLHLVEW